MNNSHIIAQCTWLSAFDRQAGVNDLQNFISQWSNSVLIDELEQCLDELCPPTQTWRIKHLPLDLGEVPLEDLAQEFPRRLRSVLRTAFERMLTHRTLSIVDNSADNMQILQHHELSAELLQCFLCNGSVPWWYRGDDSALQILDDHIARQPRDSATMIRKLGRIEIVRKRLVRQCGESRLRRVVHLLEPSHGEFICSFADNLFVTHAQQRLPTGNTSQFREHTWLFIMTHLLVDRGSVFNKTAFMRASLTQTAQRYRIDYHELLDMLYQAAQALQPGGLTTSDFVTSIKILHSQDCRPAGPPNSGPIARLDPWRVLQKMLHHGLDKGSDKGLKHDISGSDNMPISELFPSLTRQDPGRMAEMLRSATMQSATESTVSERLLEMVGPANLPMLLDLMEPAATGFCVTLVSKLLQWHKQAGLASLDNVDLSLQLPALLIEALARLTNKQNTGRQEFTLAALWAEFSKQLKHRYGVDLQAFHRQLRQCLAQDTVSATAQDKSSNHPVASQCLIGDFSSSLQPLIRENDTLNTTPDSVHTSMPMTQLWPKIHKMDRHELRQWLTRQTGRHQLLTTLSCKNQSREHQSEAMESWLPKEIVPHDTLVFLRALFLRSKAWQGATAVLDQHLSEVFWLVMLESGAAHLSASELLAAILANACLRLNIALSDCLTGFKHQLRESPNTHWQGAYAMLQKQSKQTTQPHTQHTHSHRASARTDGTSSAPPLTTEFRQDYLARYLDHPAFVDIAKTLLQKGRPPAGLPKGQSIALNRMLFDVFNFRSDLLPALLGDILHYPAVMFRILSITPFSWLVNAVRATEASRHSAQMLDCFQQWLEPITLPNTSRQQGTAILFQQVLTHWLNKKWDALAPDQLVANYISQLMRRQHIAQHTLRHAFSPHMGTLPQTLQQSVTNALSAEKTTATLTASDEPKMTKKLKTAVSALQESNSGMSPIRIRNCGMVILQGFIPTLFERLGLVENQRFLTQDCQRRAVHYLQYLTTGSRETAEEDLVLNKLLCGMALDEPVEAGIEISAEHEALCQDLLNTVIGYWGAIAGSSIDALRGNWLVREGVLTDANDHWHLVVEKRVYDLLLAQAPFSYSVIKFPWMEKALYVTWPT